MSQNETTSPALAVPEIPEQASYQDLRDILVIIEKGAPLKDLEFFRSVLSIIFYLPDITHAISELVQSYILALMERADPNLTSRSYAFKNKELKEIKEKLHAISTRDLFFDE